MSSNRLTGCNALPRARRQNAHMSGGAAAISITGGRMTALRGRQRRKKPYVTPRVVDFGAIDAMTGDCFGLCLDGMNGGLFWGP